MNNTILNEIEAQIQGFNPEKFGNLNAEWRKLVGYHNYYRWLWAAVRVIQPKNLVEIGRERGVSTSIMLDNLPADGMLTSVDIVQEAIFLENIKDSRLILLTGDSLKAAHLIPNKIDFLFIDGDHTQEQVEQEWLLYRPKLATSAIVVFDDIHFNEGMTNFWNSLEEEKYELPQWHEPGFGVVLING